MARFCTLFSGSSGNCTMIESDGTLILVDAGASARAIKKALEAQGHAMEEVQSIFVTHEHADHIRGLGVIAKHYDIPICTMAETAEVLAEKAPSTAPLLRPIEGGAPCTVGSLCVTSFDTPHDAVHSVGYIIRDGVHQFGVATDIGEMNDTILDALRGCDALLLESNHDVDRLMQGPYPYPLKRRILSPKGHLSNDDCAETVIRLLESGTEHIVLGHLSRTNNDPLLAYLVTQHRAESAGAAVGRDYELQVAPPGSPCTFAF